MSDYAVNLYHYPNPRSKTFSRIENGVRIYPDGREVCETWTAWQERREFCWRRDHGRCVFCKRPVPLHTDRQLVTGTVLAFAAICDHIVKRGMGGAKRDDRPANLRTVCVGCDQRRESGGKPCPPKPRLA